MEDAVLEEEADEGVDGAASLVAISCRVRCPGETAEAKPVALERGCSLAGASLAIVWTSDSAAATVLPADVLLGVVVRP